MKNVSFKARTVRCNVVTLDVPHTVFAPMVSRDSHPEQFSSNAKEEWDFTKLKIKKKTVQKSAPISCI